MHTPPFAGTRGWDAPEFTAEGQSAERAATNPSLNLESIHPNYFQTFEVILVRGRGFTEIDHKDAPYVAVVSEDVAARTWPGEDPIGKRLKMGGFTSAEPWNKWRTVVGVARPTRYRELARTAGDALRAGRAVHLRGLDARGAHRLTAQRGRDWYARSRAVDPRRSGHAGGALPGLPPGAARAAALQCVPDRRVRRGGAVLGGDRPVCGDGGFGSTTLHGDWCSRRARRHASDVRGLVLGEGVRLAGLGAAIGLAGARGGAACCAVFSSVSTPSTRCPCRRGLPARRRLGAGVLHPGPAGHSRRSGRGVEERAL